MGNFQAVNGNGGFTVVMHGFAVAVMPWQWGG